MQVVTFSDYCNNYHEISLTPLRSVLVARPELGREAITWWVWWNQGPDTAAALLLPIRYKDTNHVLYHSNFGKIFRTTRRRGREKLPARSAAYSNSWIWRLFLQRNLSPTIHDSKLRMARHRNSSQNCDARTNQEFNWERLRCPVWSVHELNAAKCFGVDGKCLQGVW